MHVRNAARNILGLIALFPTLSIGAWNAMQWNGMKRNEEPCTLDDKAFTHYSITVRRVDRPEGEGGRGLAHTIDKKE